MKILTPKNLIFQRVCLIYSLNRFIYVESAFFWRWWGEQDLTMKETVRELVNQGRLEFISGIFIRGDMAMADKYSNNDPQNFPDCKLQLV